MFRRALELNPNYAPARHWYSLVLDTVGRLDEALAQIQRAAELDPLSTVIKDVLGQSLASQGRFHEAEASYRRAITINPSNPGAHLGLALLNAYAFDRFTDAVPLAQKAMELDSGSPRPSFALARLYFDLGDDSKLFDMTAQAAKRWPDDPFIQLQVALVNLIRLDAAGAVRHAQRAFEVEPAAPTCHCRSFATPTCRMAVTTRRSPATRRRTRSSSCSVRQVSTGRTFGQRLISRWSFRSGATANGPASCSMAPLVFFARIPDWAPPAIGIADVAIHALRGQKAQALAALRDAEKAGWRGPGWRYYRDFDPNLASIRNEPEFKAIFADIERDMAQQRAALRGTPEGRTARSRGRALSQSKLTSGQSARPKAIVRDRPRLARATWAIACLTPAARR